MCVCVCVFAFLVCVRVCACVRARVCVCVRAYVGGEGLRVRVCLWVRATVRATPTKHPHSLREGQRNTKKEICTVSRIIAENNLKNVHTILENKPGNRPQSGFL